MIKFLIVLFAFYGSLSAQDLSEATKDYQRLFSGLRDAKSVSVVFEASMPQFGSQKSRGTLQLKGANKYRLEFNNMVTVSDGKSVYQYSKATNQVIISKFGRATNYSVEAIINTIDRSFEIVGHEQNSNVATIIFRNKDEFEFLKKISVAYNRGNMALSSVETRDNMGSVTKYYIREIDFNTITDPRVFTFNIPQGAEVVDMR